MTSLRSSSLASWVTASSHGRFDRKVGRDSKPRFSDFHVESTGFLSLQSHPTLRSNRPGELAVTQEARLDDRKLVIRFWKFYALKKHSRPSDRSVTSGVPSVGRVAQWPILSKTEHFRVVLDYTPSLPLFGSSPNPTKTQFCIISLYFILWLFNTS